MARQLSITTGTGVPIYKQLIDQVKSALASGEYVEGDQLPSIRVLAERLVVNPNTVAKAYNEMVHEGLVETWPGKGFFIATRRQRLSTEERRRRLDAAADAFIHDVLLLDFSRSEILDSIDIRLRSLEQLAGSNRLESEK
jgi:GntR family transcriptional regulator